MSARFAVMLARAAFRLHDHAERRARVLRAAPWGVS